MKLSATIRRQIEDVCPGPDSEVLVSYGGPRKLLCWLGFHDKDEYVVGDDEYTYTTTLCKCCGKKVYVSFTEENFDREDDREG